MRRFHYLLTIAGLLAAAGSARAQADPGELDLERFQGTWHVVAGEIDGRKLPEEETRKMKLVIQKNRYTLTIGAEVETGTFKLDARQKPKVLDVLPDTGPNKGRTLQAIYELESQTHRTCFAEPGGKRPETFAAPAGSKCRLFQLKRDRE
jgi:uncharacterized protein (TIGR03067 family)